MKNYLWALILLFSAAFISCDDDGVKPSSSKPPGNAGKPSGTPTNPGTPSTVIPVISITSPVTDSDLLLIETLKILGSITHRGSLKELRIFLINPDGTRSEMEAEHLKSHNNTTKTSLNLISYLPIGSATGNYTVVVEAKASQQNAVRDSVNFNVHAPALSHSEFVSPFTEVFRWSFFSVLDWSSYNTEKGISFDEAWLSMGLFLMVSTDKDYEISEAEWNRFIADFGVKNQAWSKWDVDANGRLGDAEFYFGLSRLNFFAEWDTDKDHLISNEEMSHGVFNRWDHNKDGMLSREEYLERFYTYLYR